MRLSKNVEVSIKWEIRDFWVGLYWDIKYESEEMLLTPDKILYLYICLIPCLPIIIKKEIK
jgi:hypothetical protein